jgi:hypothetical protein
MSSMTEQRFSEYVKIECQKPHSLNLDRFSERIRKERRQSPLSLFRKVRPNLGMATPST